jgi:hypothetical protein
MKRGAHDTEPMGSSRVPVTGSVDENATAHGVTEPDSHTQLRAAAAEDERLRSLLDGLGATRGPAPSARYAAPPPHAFTQTEAVHDAVTRRFETPARPQASSFNRGLQRGLLVGLPTGFAIGVAVALGAVLVFLPVGGPIASPPPRPSAPAVPSGASMPAAVLAPSATPAAVDGPPTAALRPRASTQASHDAPGVAPARKSAADRPVPEKNTMTNEL